MPKFKNKKTGLVLEENINFYIKKLRDNPNFEEIKEKEAKPKENNKNKEEEVESTPQK